jgi:hypothetical protein
LSICKSFTDASIFWNFFLYVSLKGHTTPIELTYALCLYLNNFHKRIIYNYICFETSKKYQPSQDRALVLIVSVCQSRVYWNHLIILFLGLATAVENVFRYIKEMEECRDRASRHAARIRIELTLEVIYYLFFLFLLIARTSKLFFHNSRWHGTKPLPYEQHLQWILNHGGQSLDLYWTFNNVYNGSNLAIHTWCVT